MKHSASLTVEVRLRRRWLIRLAAIMRSRRLAAFAIRHAYGEWRSRGSSTWRRINLADLVELNRG